MLRIHEDSVVMVREVARIVERSDGDLARQMRRASSSVTLNISEGSYSRKGNRLARWQDAMGSANETRSALQLAAAVGLAEPSSSLLDLLHKMVATLWKLTRWHPAGGGTPAAGSRCSERVLPRSTARCPPPRRFAQPCLNHLKQAAFPV